MSDTIINKLLEIAPQLGILILFLISLWLLIKEYRSLRSDIDSTVNSTVDAKLGSLIGKIKIESSQATELLENINKIYSNSQSMFADFKNMGTERIEQVNQTLSEVEEKLELLGQALPSSTAYSAQDYGVLAERATSLGEALTLIEKAQNDPDATSSDLEKLGDIARKLRKWSLAKSLYGKAAQIDPENNSAKIELLCLSAETNAKDREDYLRQAEDLVLATLQTTILSRLSNAYIVLNRYPQLEAICRKVLEQSAVQESSIYIQAYRNLAVSLKEQQKYSEADDAFKIALQSGQKDENLLKAYIGLLREVDAHDRALPIAEKLLDIDPTDPQYYVIFARELVAVGKNEDAIQWYELGEKLVPNTNIGLKEVFRQEKLKAILRKEIHSNIKNNEDDIETAA